MATLSLRVVWARGILQTEYGVDLNNVTWAPTDEEHVAEYIAPTNVNYSHRGKPMADLFLAGIPAAVGDVRVNSPEIQPLIPDAQNAGFAYFRKTGVYPINHGLVVKDSLLKADPGLGERSLRPFQEAKQIYLRHLDSGEVLSRRTKLQSHSSR